MAEKKKSEDLRLDAMENVAIEDAAFSEDQLKDMEKLEQRGAEIPEVEIPPIADEESVDDVEKALDDLDKLIDAEASKPKRGRKKAAEKAEVAEKKDEKPATSSKRRQSKGLPDYLPSGDLTNRASRKEKRDIYREEEIFTIDPERASVKTEQVKRRETWFKLIQASESGQPLEGTLYSCIKAKGANGETHVLGVVSFECATIYIPVELLYKFDESNIITNTGMTREQTILNTKAYFTNLRFGMKVKFCVLRVFEKNPMNEDGGPMAYGSRIDALEKLGNDNYVKPQRSDGKPLIVEGMLVEATITCLTISGVYVEAAGVEEFIPNDELSWRHIADARTDIEDYYVGKIILVKVKKIEKEKYKAQDRKFDLVKLTLSAKEAVPNMNKKNFNNFVVGETTLATVTMISEDGMFVMLGDNQRDALCRFPRNGEPIPPIDSLIRTKITRKDEKEYRIFCEYKGMIRVGRG